MHQRTRSMQQPEVNPFLNKCQTYQNLHEYNYESPPMKKVVINDKRQYMRDKIHTMVKSKLENCKFAVKIDSSHDASSVIQSDDCK